MPNNDEVLAKWTAQAPYWETHSETIRGMFAPVSDALIEEAHVAAGHTVLDVATGTGEPALTVARLVGPAGSVVGIDPVAEMIAAGTRAAEAQRLPNARFQTASADALPFPNAHFDAVVCRFGVMFFPSPVQGVREMLRVTKPGRTVAFAVWSFAAQNPFHCLLSNVVDRYVAPDPVLPDAPGAFRFAESGKLLNIVREAGAANATERLYHFPIKVALSAEAYWALRLQMSDKLRSKVAALPPDTQAALRQDLLEAHRPYAMANGLSLPAEVLIGSGDAPS